MVALLFFAVTARLLAVVRTIQRQLLKDHEVKNVNY